MKKKMVIALVLALGVSMCFSGCSKKKKAEENGQAASGEQQQEAPASQQAGAQETPQDTEVEDLTEDEDEDVPEFDSEYGAISDGAVWGYNYEGSAVYTEGKTAVVTVKVNGENSDFTDAELTKMKTDAKKALDFITKSAKEYGKTAEFVFDEPDLNLELDYDDAVDDFEYDDYDGILSDLIKAKLDTAAVKDKYQADGIMYLFFLNGVGDSFSSAHWVEDEEYYFNEAAYIFKQSYDDNYDEVETGPNVYLYQILQLFGAVQLDYPDATSGYTSALMDAVNENYNNDIMVGFLEEDGSIDPSEITREITDITAYTIGLTDTFEELDANPSFKKAHKCSFVDGYMTNTKDGTDTSAYDYSGSLDAEGGEAVIEEEVEKKEN